MPIHVCQKMHEPLTTGQGLIFRALGRFRVRLLTEAQYQDYLNGATGNFETVIVDDKHQHDPYFPATENVARIAIEEIGESYKTIFIEVELADWGDDAPPFAERVKAPPFNARERES